MPRARAARRERSLVVAAVAVGSAAVAAFLWFFHAPASGVVQLQTIPPDAAVTVDGRPIGGVSPFSIRGLTTGTAHTIVVQKPGYKLWSSQFEASSGEPLRLPDVALEAIESGFALDSVPSGAHVYVDGQQLEQATPVRVSALRPGDHRIRVEAEGYAPWESSLKVTPGVVLDLPVAQLIARTPEPLRRSDALIARIPPAAGSQTGSESSHREVPARRVTTPPPGDDVADVPAPKVNLGKTPSEAATSVPSAAAPPASAMGTLRIQTRPWSSVYLDGRSVGTTPLMGLSAKAGRHTLTLVNEEFGIRKTVVVQLEAGQVLTQVLNLSE